MQEKYPSDLPATWHPLARVFTALGDENRQRILLRFKPGESLNATQIADASTLARPTVSHHLRLLTEAGVLDRCKVGREVHFRINAGRLREALQAVLGYLDGHP